MKFARRLPVKLIAWLLCLACVVLGTVSLLAISQLARYGGYSGDQDGMVAEMQADSLYEDIYLVELYYSLLMCGQPWTQELIPQYEAYFDEDSTNFFFTLTDYDTGEVLLSSYEGETAASLRQEAYLTAANYYDNYYEYVLALANLTNTPAMMSTTASSYDADEAAYDDAAITADSVADDSLRHVMVNGYVSASNHAWDKYSAIRAIGAELYRHRRDAAIALAASAAGALLCLGLLLAGAGRRAKAPGLRLGPVARMPWDLALVLGTGAGFGLVVLYNYLSNAFYTSFQINGVYNQNFYLLSAGAGLACGGLALGLLFSFAARCKGKGWLKNCLIYRVLVWLRRPLGRLWDTLRSLPLLWKTVLFCAGMVAAECWCLTQLYWSGFVLPIILLNIAVCLVLLACAACNKRLALGCRAIAAGDMDHRVDTRRLFGDFKAQAEDLNRIGSGISAAVEERLKSERFKTELITNVSHDLKTPLTSIVNYVDLLSKLTLPQEARTYVEVLQRQSARLKKLTEDLVEASKASTGNLSVEIAPLNLGELVSQVTGEYGDRFGRAGVTPVLQLPEEKITALGDGRYLWRVMDNLFSNVCKYALAGTRVYIFASILGERAVISVKNISREQLNISADELMERFVRGDASRNTEGSGLGLSIARSLAELMGGKLSLTVDGDLFKAEVRLPLA